MTFSNTVKVKRRIRRSLISRLTFPANEHVYQLPRISSSIDEELRSRAKDVAIKKRKKKEKKKKKERRSSVPFRRGFCFYSKPVSTCWPVQLPSTPERIFTVVQTVANYRYVMPIVPEETSIHSFSLVFARRRVVTRSINENSSPLILIHRA